MSSGSAGKLFVRVERYDALIRHLVKHHDVGSTMRIRQASVKLSTEPYRVNDIPIARAYGLALAKGKEEANEALEAQGYCLVQPPHRNWSASCGSLRVTGARLIHKMSGFRARRAQQVAHQASTRAATTAIRSSSRCPATASTCTPTIRRRGSQASLHGRVAAGTATIMRHHGRQPMVVRAKFTARTMLAISPGPTAIQVGRVIHMRRTHRCSWRSER